MKKINVTKDTKIFVACPANSATGGPEALHQLVYELNKLELNAFMYYYNRSAGINPVHQAYSHYQNNFVDEIDDSLNNILIVPETNTGLLYQYHAIQKFIWWLSIDNYSAFLNSNNKIIKYIKRLLYILNLYPRKVIYRFSKNDKIIHFVQSEYAKQMLIKKGIKNIFYLHDYLNKYFIEDQTKKLNTVKENIVVYNPKKGYQFTSSIIAYAQDIKFYPIENMSREQVAQILSKSKVYIDFGNHPGKDRLPREAAISGCCVITGKDGSAKYFEDVPIPNEFKFDAKLRNIPLIVEKIKNCFLDYETNSKKFDNYREKIKFEQTEFVDEIKKIFLDDQE